MQERETKDRLLNGIPTSFTYGITEVGKTAYIHYIRKYACHWYHPRRLQDEDYINHLKDMKRIYNSDLNIFKSK